MFKMIFFYTTLKIFYFLRFSKLLYLVELKWNKLFQTSGFHSKKKKKVF